MSAVKDPDLLEIHQWLLKHADNGHTFFVGSACASLVCRTCGLVWANDASDDYPTCPTRWKALTP